LGKFIIEGPVRLNGEVEISGAKNSALPIMAASILSSGDVSLKNVPDLGDVRTMIDILNSAGFKVSFENNILSIKKADKLNSNVPYELVSKMRASFNVLGPLTVVNGEATVALPGGCSIGVRPVDFHIEGLKKLGFEVEQQHGFVTARKPKKLSGDVNIYLKYPSVGTTEHLMTTATLMKGCRVTLNNVALEPEIIDLQNFLNSMGAKIIGAGTSTIIIEGVEKLSGTDYSIIPDRIEAGTFIIAILASEGTGKVKNVIPSHLDALFEKLREIGTKFDILEPLREVHIPRNNLRELSGTDIDIEPYPGFPTDLQPQMMAFLSLVNGKSVIVENVFKSRFLHVDELKRMGARIDIKGNTAIIDGGVKYTSAPVQATDIRASAALLIAAICADGVSIINNIEHIFRGYENVIEKFKKLGAKIEYIKE
jgi:UDP-N-acetylglucosamine 1-carboxyvinyltransferase